MTGSIVPGCPRCGLDHGTREGHPPAWLVKLARNYIASVESDAPADPRDQGGFVFARTMAANPHHYVTRGKAKERADRATGHEALFQLIKWYYTLRFWRGTGYKSLDIDGFSYWILTDGTVINRKPVSDAGWDPSE